MAASGASWQLAPLPAWPLFSTDNCEHAEPTRHSSLAGVAGEASSAAPGPHLRRMHPCCRHGRAYMALERLWIQSVTQLSGLEEVFGDLRLDQVVLIQRL